MNIFEFAMQMELDGKAYYEQHAQTVDHPKLKEILMEMASDEQKHYIIFKAMRDGQKAEYKENEASKIITSVKNVFEELKETNQDFSFTDDAKLIWEHARDVEKKAEAFYREKADEVSDENQKHILNRIADEEHKHWVMMENIIQFLDRPAQWLSDAEWNNWNDF